jgi:RNA methyltransferase, TrmH family
VGTSGARNRARGVIASNLLGVLRDLQRRKARGRRGLAPVEGIRLVEEALAAGLVFRGVVVAPSLERTARGTELRSELEQRAIPVEEVAERTFAQLADTDTPQGIVAIVQARKWTPADLATPAPPAPPGRGRALLVIDGVQDPGNVGTLIRTAHALGAGGTIVLRGTADVNSPKALRAAMGASFRHPVVSMDDNAFIAWTRRGDVTLWATAADGTPLDRALREEGTGKGEGGGGRVEGGPIAVIVGNEGAGIRPALNAIAARRVAIPLAQGAESLNVAVAAGILLYEVLRGR